MRKLLYSLSAVAFAMLTACTSDVDDVFGKSAAERVEETINADKEVLTSAGNGWRLEYYPQDGMSYGGYNVYLKFDKAGNVTAASEVYGKDATSTSLYSIKQSAGVVLTIDTNNEVFHFFSDPKNPAGIGSDGKGMEGDFEFQIMEAKADKVILKGKKTGVKMVMTPVADGVEWSDEIAKINAYDEIYSTYPQFKYHDGDFEAKLSHSYHHLNVEYTDGEATMQESVPYIIESDGTLSFRTPLTMNGKTVQNFKYIDAEEPYFESVDAAGVVLKPFYSPAWFFSNKDWYMSLSGMSQKGYWGWWIQNVYPQLGAAPKYMLFTPYDGVDVALYWELAGNTGLLLYNVTVLSDDEIFINFASRGNNFGVTCWNNYSWIQFQANFNSKTFKIAPDDDKNPTELLLTDVDDNTNTIRLSANEILDPINN